jgi:hypothetical protein
VAQRHRGVVGLVQWEFVRQAKDRFGYASALFLRGGVMSGNGELDAARSVFSNYRPEPCLHAQRGATTVGYEDVIVSAIDMITANGGRLEVSICSTIGSCLEQVVGRLHDS